MVDSTICCFVAQQFVMLHVYLVYSEITRMRSFFRPPKIMLESTIHTCRDTTQHWTRKLRITRGHSELQLKNVRGSNKAKDILEEAGSM